MKISLRKAHALQQEIRRMMGEWSPSVVVKLDESVSSDALPDLVESHRENYTAQLARYTALSETLSAIRARVATANQESGVDEMLSELAHLDRMIRLCADAAGMIGEAVDAENTPAIQFKLDALRNQDRKSMYRMDSDVRVALRGRDELHCESSAFRRQRVAVNDRLLEANVGSKIELTDREVQVLRDSRLID
ncbi:MAG: hypothetical protein ACRC16_26540 [Aeromonas salmonicida]